MAKPSSLDAKIAEIDGEIARLTEALERWQGMRYYLTKGSVAHVAAPEQAAKPKRTRGPNRRRGLADAAKRGTQTATQPDDESARMAADGR